MKVFMIICLAITAVLGDDEVVAAETKLTETDVVVPEEPETPTEVRHHFQPNPVFIPYPVQYRPVAVPIVVQDDLASRLIAGNLGVSLGPLGSAHVGGGLGPGGIGAGVGGNLGPIAGSLGGGVGLTGAGAGFNLGFAQNKPPNYYTHYGLNYHGANLPLGATYPYTTNYYMVPTFRGVMGGYPQPYIY